MAQPSLPKTGEKRGPGRPPKNSTPLTKKQRISVDSSSGIASQTAKAPIADSLGPDKKGTRQPYKISDARPLPTLSAAHSLELPGDEYLTIPATSVLAESLERSRLRWTNGAVFQKYWTKPERGAGKNSKPLPPNNPELKWMKSKGECRIRLEPHLFVADVFVEEKPRPKQQAIQNHGTYGQQQYRPPQGPHQFPNQLNPSSTSHATYNLPRQELLHQSPAATSSASVQQQHDKKKPDPVISMLASRASSDLELAALMKKVATGSATDDESRVFQKHLDELTALIQKQKEDDVRVSDAVTVQMQLHRHPQQLQQPHSRTSYASPHLQPLYQSAQTSWTPPTSSPVILEFKTLGASEDRFLFPEYSILERLSPQHELVSFMTIRKGYEAVDTAGLETQREYWQPVTMMVEVAYGREEIMSCIRRWVKPAAEVRQYMEDVMQRCQRAPQNYLALRLPIKGSGALGIEHVFEETTPTGDEDASKQKSTAKAAKKPALSKGKSTAGAPVKKKGDSDCVDTSTTAAHETSAKNASDNTTGTTDAQPSADASGQSRPDGVDGIHSTPAPDMKEAPRLRRTVRKSVRISEG